MQYMEKDSYPQRYSGCCEYSLKSYTQSYNHVLEIISEATRKRSESVNKISNRKQ